MSKKEATPRKLKNAREEGNSGASTFATSAIAFVVALALLPVATRAAITHTVVLIRSAIAHAGDRAPSAMVAPGALATELIVMVVPLLLATAAAAAVVSGVQA